MPMKTFWMMSENVRRIQAQNDMRAMSVAITSQGGEAFKEHHERLVIELGDVVKEPVVPDAVRDEEGFKELKMLAAAMM